MTGRGVELRIPCHRLDGNRFSQATSSTEQQRAHNPSQEPMSLLTPPAAMQFTVMFFGPRSQARHFTRPVTAALEAA
jgi:hypothetical protein